MGNAKYPTLSQTLPYFNRLAHKLNTFLGCSEENEPNYDELEIKGTPVHLAKAVQRARNKLGKYSKLAKNPESLHCMATGKNCRQFFQFLKNKTFYLFSSPPKI